MPLPACIFGFAEGDCVVDAVKPTVNVDNPGLLALMGCMDKGRSGVFSRIRLFEFCNSVWANQVFFFF